MGIFPIELIPTKESTVSSIRNTIKSNLDGGYTQVRPKYTRKRLSFKLVFILNSDDMDTLRDFFDDNHGTSFTLNHPYKNTTHTVYFDEDTLEEQLLSYSVFKVQVTLKEV